MHSSCYLVSKLKKREVVVIIHVKVWVYENILDISYDNLLVRSFSGVNAETDLD